MQYDFSMLCWAAGFACRISGRNELDKPALCEFLSCSRRSLDRWLDPLDKTPPCPRAVKLLNSQCNTLPLSWQHEGARFTRHNELYFTDWRQPLKVDIVKQLPDIRARASQLRGYLDDQKRYINTLRDPAEHARLQRKLLDMSAELEQLAGVALIDKKRA